MAKFKDRMGKWITQGLILELGYKPTAIYTRQDDNVEYKGKTYPSLKKLFIESYMIDPTEYQFATKYLGGWQHWKRMKNNKQIRDLYEEWQEEAEIKVRALGVRSAIDMALDGKSFAAAKWLAEAGYDKRGAGRPSKQEVVRATRIEAGIKDELDDDWERILGGK
jgi:hypothetical protein